MEGVGFRCIDDLYSSSVCSSECSARIRDGVQSYGCCANVVIDYNNQFDNQYEDDDNIENEFTELFFKCGVTRPARCTNSLLTTPSPDLTPQPPSSTTQPASHFATVMSIAFVGFAAVLM